MSTSIDFYLLDSARYAEDFLPFAMRVRAGDYSVVEAAIDSMFGDIHRTSAESEFDAELYAAM
ncbi:MAG: hypothetical protein ABI876_16325, partial [Bacteroidota bacterium]